MVNETKYVHPCDTHLVCRKNNFVKKNFSCGNHVCRLGAHTLCRYSRILFHKFSYTPNFLTRPECRTSTTMHTLGYINFAEYLLPKVHFCVEISAIP